MSALAISVRIAVILTALLIGGCPAPRQRDKDSQTGMGPADHAIVRALHDQRVE